MNVSDVRTEYPLLTSDLCADARVTANRDRAEAEIEAVLRDRYDLTDPGADKYVWRVCLALTLDHCINSAYGEQGWTGEGRNAAKFYGVVECLCNLTAEEEAAVEEERKRVKVARSI